MEIVLHRSQLDQVTIPPEVSGVEREELALTVGQHGGNDVGVVYLAAANGDLPAQGNQPLRNQRSVLKGCEHGGQLLRVVQE